MAEQKAEGLGAEAFRFTVAPEAPTIEKETPQALAARGCGCACGCGGSGGAGGGGGLARAASAPPTQ